MLKDVCALPLILLCIWSAVELNAVQGQYGSVAGDWKVSFVHKGATKSLRVGSKSVRPLNVTISDVDLSGGVDFYFELEIEDPELAFVDKHIRRHELVVTGEPEDNLAEWHGTVQVAGRHLGYTRLYVVLRPEVGVVESSVETLKVTVLRDKFVDDAVFGYIAGALVLIMFVNLGTALDLLRFKSILLKPFGPLIALCGRFLLMPALSLAMGYLFFRQDQKLQLAVFLTALAPSGGLANICIVFLKGNLNLSIAITTINSLLALAMMPLWVIVLARILFDDSSLSLPYLDLAMGSVLVIIAVSSGVVLRIFFPKATRYIYKFLKPLSLLLSLSLIALTVGFNAFVFKHITLMIFLVALLLPICGYLIAFGLSKVLCQTSTSALTIAIETGVLNMTVPIVLLQYTLRQPKADMAIVVPIVTALTSICLVVVFYAVRRIFGWNTKYDPDAFTHKELLAAQNIDITKKDVDCST